jgi:hypothetical protein
MVTVKASGLAAARHSSVSFNPTASTRSIHLGNAL